MEFELLPRTEAGKRMVDLAEMHAEDFATRADEHDRNGTFGFENIEAIKKSGFAASVVPEECGGLGVTSIHDCIVAMKRLGRGDGATALAYIMHLGRSLATVRASRNATATGNQGRQQQNKEILRKIGAGELIIAVANSERGATGRTSRTLATKVDGGWIFNGAKQFATGTPAADLVAVRARYQNEAGEIRLGAAMVPVTRAGIDIKDNWDGMGMRGSGSHDVIFTDYFVKDEEFADIGEFGKYNPQLIALASVGSMGMPAIFLGMAETAHSMAVTAIKNRETAGDPMNQVTVAENEIDLAACRGILGRAAQSYDDFYQTDTGARVSVSSEQAFQIMKNTACAKKFVMDRSGVMVDRAMTLVGGSSFLNSNTLSRLYRDVRAGPFMRPWSRNEATEIIGLVALGVDPNED